MHKVIFRTILMSGLVLAPAVVMASGGSGNYQHCVQQKQTVAKTYCNKAGTDCKSELKAVRRECRAEVKKGLRFKQDSD